MAAAMRRMGPRTTSHVNDAPRVGQEPIKDVARPKPSQHAPPALPEPGVFVRVLVVAADSIVDFHAAESYGSGIACRRTAR
jgi:hypothetical protein